MSKFRPWGFWPAYMLFFPIVIGLLAIAGAILAPSLQTIVVAGAVAVSCGYISWRYGHGRQRLAREHADYVAAYDVNVFCIDAETRSRWNFASRALLIRALHDVAEKMGSNHLRHFDIRILSRPFPQPGTTGLNRGTWMFERDIVTLAWLPNETGPGAMHHEFAHVILSRRENLHGDAAEAAIRKLGW